MRVAFFLVKMRWFPDNVIVLLREVVMDLYMAIIVGSFFRNALTSLYVTLPSDEAEYSMCKIALTFQNDSNV